ncbi:papain fold toxin domain-containing protein [Roseofilum reptotaenium CS-1145]|uniref:Tox-PL-2 domain-containing protein n=1 Tax=Roseofilum reptotaenium AO1-A TaxID=1925591 RepID=A0A1L9QJZ9_9CYAN|nr:papain fold toxin domain-containing protein [Roseofilum reptotaenium]MDB9515348.1 papain fold toxin domain-containing protein [Roseofilum reptotaenium CS-1145]OJJ15491.1 hypothetical protein BI308_24355 [Roseofilum reptotaenium AO1-A]
MTKLCTTDDEIYQRITTIAGSFQLFECEVCAQAIQEFLIYSGISGLYLGKAALSQFQTFLDGYTFALRQLKIPVSQEEQEFEGFHIKSVE